MAAWIGLIRHQVIHRISSRILIVISKPTVCSLGGYELSVCVGGEILVVISVWRLDSLPHGYVPGGDTHIVRRGRLVSVLHWV